MASEWRVEHLVFTRHAITQIFARSITMDEVKAVVSSPEIIADYADDQPCPSRLLLGFPGGEPLHVVLGYNEPERTGYIVTAYRPDAGQWEPDFKRRKTP